MTKKKIDEFFLKLSVRSNHLKAIGAVLVLILLVVFLPFYARNFSDLMRSFGAGSVSDQFIDELMRESDTATMLQNARNSGLTVESYVYDTEEYHLIKESGTGKVLMVETSNELWGLPGGAQGNIVRLIAIVRGYPLVCEIEPGSGVLTHPNGVPWGIRKLQNQVRIIPGNTDPAFVVKINDAMAGAIGRLNSTFGSSVPKFQLNNGVSTADVDVVFVHMADTKTIARAKYRTDGNLNSEHTILEVNTNSNAVNGWGASALNNAIVHEIGHALGLQHSTENVMSGEQKGDDPLLGFNQAQIDGLQAAYNSSAKFPLSNCKAGEAEDELTENPPTDTGYWSSYMKRPAHLVGLYQICGNPVSPCSPSDGTGGMLNPDGWGAPIYWCSRGGMYVPDPSHPLAEPGIWIYQVSVGRQISTSIAGTLLDTPDYACAVPISPEIDIDSLPIQPGVPLVPPPDNPDFVFPSEHQPAPNDKIINPDMWSAVFHGPPATSTATISSSNVKADNSTIYTIPVSVYDESGLGHIKRVQAVINRQGASSGNFRGYMAWSSSGNPYINGKDQKTCAGGGVAAINPEEKYGPSYVALDSCSISASGNTRVVNFKVKFNDSFTSPSVNKISGAGFNDLGSLGWQEGTSFTVIPPTPPPDTAPPIISDWDVQPRISTVGGTIAATFTATDSGGTHFKKAELLFAPYDSIWCKVEETAGCGWTITNTINAPSNIDDWTGTLTTTIPNIGYVPAGNPLIYGLTIYDGADNRVYEPYVIKVDLTAAATPTPISTPSPSRILYSDNTLTFNTTLGSGTPIGGYISIGTADSTPINWVAVPDQSWCHINPSSATNSTGGRLSVSADTMSSAGTYNCRITFSEPDFPSLPAYFDITYIVTADSTAPSISSFSVSPITTSNTVTASFTVSDAGGSYLKQVDLMRAPYNASNCTPTIPSGCSWSAVKSGSAPANSNSWTNTLIDTPPLGSSYIYGLQAIDNAGNRGYEPVRYKVDAISPDVTLFSDSFEISEWNGLWTEDSQNDWYRSSQRGSNGSYSAEVDGSANNATFTSSVINLQGKTNTVITFDWYIESGLDSGEYVSFETSTDSGATWVEKARIKGNVDMENTWKSVNVSLSGINNLRIRFKGYMSDSDEDADVDNVKVVGTSSSQPTPTPTPTQTPTQTPPSGEISLFSDSFEIAEWNSLWTEDSQNDWFRSSQRDTQGSYSAEVDGNASNATLTSSVINLQNKTNARITFDWYIESGLDSGEYISFETSTDNGSTWVEKARVRGNVDSENNWKSQTITLSSISNLRIRFRATMSDSDEDANVDNVKVIGY